MGVKHEWNIFEIYILGCTNPWTQKCRCSFEHWNISHDLVPQLQIADIIIIDIIIHLHDCDCTELVFEMFSLF